MAKYKAKARKKIDAVQFDGTLSDAVRGVIELSPLVEVRLSYTTPRTLTIKRNAQTNTATEGQWIVRNENGAFTIMGSEEFAVLYEIDS